MKIFLLTIFSAFMLQNSYAANLGVEYPTTIGPNHSANLFLYQKRFGLLQSDSYLKRLLAVGKRDLKTYEEFLSKDQKFLVKEYLVRIERLVTIDEHEQKIELINQIIELIHVYQEIFYVLEPKYPPRSVYNHPFFKGSIHPYYKSISIIDNQKYTKRTYSRNLVGEDGEFLSVEELDIHNDRSKLNPKESSFWKKYKSNKSLFDYHQSEDYKLLCSSNPVFEFRKKKKRPEEGGGLNPGVKVYTIDPNGKKRKAKLKFAMVRKRGSFVPLFQKQEAYLEPTGNALYKLLGYNVDTGLYCPDVNVKFHPEMFNLTNSNRINTQLWDLEHYFSDFILLSGEKVKFDEVVNKLTYFDHTGRTFKDPWAKIITKYYIKDKYKGQISNIILHGAYIEYKKTKRKRFSSWKKEVLSHQDRREVRALGIFDSWLGAADNFANNLKISVKKSKGKIKDIEYILSDMGDIFTPHYRLIDEVMGNYPTDLKALLDNDKWVEFNKVVVPYKKSSELELQLNSFTFNILKKSVKNKSPKWNWYDENGKMDKIQKEIQLMNSMSVIGINKFTLLEDYMWGVRQIAKISEKNILHSLCLSGLGYPGALLLTEKLISRRDELVKYFGLEGEFKLLRPNGANINMNVEGDGEIIVKDNNGKKVKVRIPSYSNIVINGEFYTSK